MRRSSAGRPKKWAGPHDYWLVTTGEDRQPGINGPIMYRPEPRGTGFNTVDVPSVDFIQKTTGAGATVVMPKTAVPAIGFLAYCAVTEGNVLVMIQNDPSTR